MVVVNYWVPRTRSFACFDVMYIAMDARNQNRYFTLTRASLNRKVTPENEICKASKKAPMTLHTMLSYMYQLKWQKHIVESSTSNPQFSVKETPPTFKLLTMHIAVLFQVLLLTRTEKVLAPLKFRILRLCLFLALRHPLHRP